jgi:hypothetical protein
MKVRDDRRAGDLPHHLIRPNLAGIGSNGAALNLPVFRRRESSVSTG